MKKIVLFMFLSLSLSAQKRQKQVAFMELMDAHAGKDDQVVRIYSDKKGALYPRNKLYIPYKEFFNPDGSYKNTFKCEEKSGNLEYYFKSTPERIKALAKEYSIDPFKSSDKIFQEVEDKIFTETISALKKQVDAGTSKILIILIHGFNDPNPTGDYRRMREYITNYKSIKDATYLEVYWDGLSANSGNPGSSAIWSFAQQNSAYVANTVRKILCSLDSEIKIRIITHSLGASVGTGALFNTYNKWSVIDHQKFYTDMMATPAPSQADIRLGMIAPAIPGVSTFVDFSRRKGTAEIDPKTNNISRVVIGYKSADFALQKGYLKKNNFLAKVFGATSLGSNPRTKGVAEIDRVKSTLDDNGYKGINPVYDVNFITSGPYASEHGLYYYMQNTKALEQFLDLVFD